MSRKSLRLAIMGLLLFTGIFHLAVALIGPAAGMRWPLAAFGIIYSAAGMYLRKDKNHNLKRAMSVALGVTAIGLTLGGYSYITKGGPGVLAAMLLIDVVILVLGAMWFANKKGHH